ncbi:MAG: SAM-dependent chlorinase/fluorinase [Anaerolineales bacterium]
MQPIPLITLTTDFGLQDGFVGAMKGVMLGICPAAHIVDISHEIPPQNILAGALTLAGVFRYFPAGTIHLAVVDPGVGTARRPLAARLGDYFFVGPDNGLFTPLYEEAETRGWTMEFVHLTNEAYFLPNVSRTFHGRDLFSPVAAHLAAGVGLAALGPAFHDPVRLPLPRPERLPGGWRGHIIAIDHFGNLTTDLTADLLAAAQNVLVRLGGFEVRGIQAAYGESRPGSLIALFDSQGRLEVAVVQGSAAARTGAQIGDVVEVSLASASQSDEW